MTAPERLLIERLRYRALCASPGVLRDAFTQAADEIAALRSENERLREALEPFADIADFLASETQGFEETDNLGVHIEDFRLWELSVGDVRRAREALASSQNPAREGVER